MRLPICIAEKFGEVINLASLEKLNSTNPAVMAGWLPKYRVYDLHGPTCSLAVSPQSQVKYSEYTSEERAKNGRYGMTTAWLRLLQPSRWQSAMRLTS